YRARLLTQWGDPVFAALAPAADVCPAVQCHVTAVEPGELRNPQSSLEGENQESVVAPPDPSGTIQATDQAVHFFLGEVGDDSPIGPLGWNGEYSLYKRGVFRMAVGGEAEQGAHGGQFQQFGYSRQVPVGCCWSGVAQVGRQQRQSLLDIQPGAIPGNHRLDGEGMSQIVKTWPAMRR